MMFVAMLGVASAMRREEIEVETILKGLALIQDDDDDQEHRELLYTRENVSSELMTSGSSFVQADDDPLCFGSNYSGTIIPTTYTFSGDCTGWRLRSAMFWKCRYLFPDVSYLDELCAAAKLATDYANGRDLEYLLGMSSQDLMLHFDGLGNYNVRTEETLTGEHDLTAETDFMEDVMTHFAEPGGHVFWPTQHQMNSGTAGVTYPQFECDATKCENGCCSSCEDGYSPIAINGTSCGSGPKYECCKPPAIEDLSYPSCELNAVMCCFSRDRSANNNQGSCREPYDTRCFDEDPADNTDLCHVNFTRGAASSHLRGGMAYFDGDVEGPTHCHGTAWSDDVLHSSHRYLGTNLFYIAFYDHLRDRGYVQNIPGAPMCGCIEEMPTVSRSDCTEIVLTESWEFVIRNDAFHRLRRTDAEVRFISCRGVNGTRNDLESYFLTDTIAGLEGEDAIRPYLAGTCPNL